MMSLGKDVFLPEVPALVEQHALIMFSGQFQLCKVMIMI